MSFRVALVPELQGASLSLPKLWSDRREWARKAESQDQFLVRVSLREAFISQLSFSISSLINFGKFRK